MIYDVNCKIPTINVHYDEAQRLKAYVVSGPHPTLSFEPMGMIVGIHRHPAVAYFSSRGPSTINNMVLKPDILRPSINRLGAHTMSPTSFEYMSGTSMACPHLLGIAAMLMSLHPTWSPAMIKSAIMTTSDWRDKTRMPIADHTGKRASLFVAGAGQVNGTRPADPGFVYDIQHRDYVKYVCGLGYEGWQVDQVIREPVDCAGIGIRGEQLNYPSFYVEVSSITKIITRTVMNVGRPGERYTLSLDQPPDARIHVYPNTLNFSHVRQNHSYIVHVTSTNPWRSLGEVAEGHLT